MKKRIFIGLFNVANIGISLKKGFEKLGYSSDFYSLEKTFHKYNYYENDIQLVHKIRFDSKIKLFNRLFLYFLLLKIIFRYDYFIFIIGSKSYFLRNLFEFRLFNFFNKKTCLICVGCDVRVPELVMKYNWNPCKICNDEYKSFVGCVPEDKMKKNINLEKTFKFIFSPNECGAGFNKYHNILFPVKIYAMPKINRVNRSNNFIIVHAPSNELIKGSSYINDAILKLQKIYNIKFVKIMNVPKIKVHEMICSADLIIDQMLVGFYGNFAVEAMLLGKPVICYIRDDIWEDMKYECPIYNANPDNLYEVLENILKNPEQLKERGKRSREYAVKYHSPEKVAKYILSKLENSD